jgi:hypothetical protein
MRRARRTRLAQDLDKQDIMADLESGEDDGQDWAEEMTGEQSAAAQRWTIQNIRARNGRELECATYAELSHFSWRLRGTQEDTGPETAQGSMERKPSEVVMSTYWARSGAKKHVDIDQAGVGDPVRYRWTAD